MTPAWLQLLHYIENITDNIKRYNMNTKRLKVVVLPTEQPTNIFERTIHNGRRYFSNYPLNPQTGNSINSSVIGLFMYWIDESAPIQEGDWFFANQTINLCSEIKPGDDYPYGTKNIYNDNIYHSKHWSGIVVATNDMQCAIVPAIPPSAIQKWIEEPYEYVEVEMKIAGWESIHDEYSLEIKVVDGYVVPV